MNNNNLILSQTQMDSYNWSVAKIKPETMPKLVVAMQAHEQYTCPCTFIWKTSENQDFLWFLTAHAITIAPIKDVHRQGIYPICHGGPRPQAPAKCLRTLPRLWSVHSYAKGESIPAAASSYGTNGIPRKTYKYQPSSQKPAPPLPPNPNTPHSSRRATNRHAEYIHRSSLAFAHTCGIHGTRPHMYTSKQRFPIGFLATWFGKSGHWQFALKKKRFSE